MVQHVGNRALALKVKIAVMISKPSTKNLSQEEEVEEDVKEQIIKANKKAGCMNNEIWRNNYLRTETKSKTYKKARRLSEK